MHSEPSYQLDPERLSQETLREYWENPNRYSHQFGASKQFTITVDSRDQRIQLLAPKDGPKADVDLLKNVMLDTDEEHDKFRLTIDAPEMPEAAYSLAFSVARGIQDGKSFHDALQIAMDAMRDVLAKRHRLSDEQVAGLFGELLVLEHLLHKLSPIDAVDAWLGPDGEEHDFSIDGVDIEVKTTLSEKRVHVISGVDQLLPRVGVPLWLLSIQLTRAGIGEGATLDEMCKLAIDEAGAAGQIIRERLAKIGWTIADYGLYTTRFGQRSIPRAYHVTGNFPSITGERLGAAVPHVNLISDVRYRIDVAGLPYGVPSADLTGFIDEGKS